MSKTFSVDLSMYSDMVREFRRDSIWEYGNMCNATLGLVGEAIESYASVMDGGDDYKEDLLFELGDVLFYLSWIIDEAGLSQTVPVMPFSSAPSLSDDKVLRSMIMASLMLVVIDAGKVSENVKKTVFPAGRAPNDDLGVSISRILTHMMNVCLALGVPLELVMSSNYGKLSARYDK